MQFITLNKNNKNQTIEQAVRSIRFGRLVVAKADTSYAILGLPQSKRAMDELKRIKNGRGSKQYSVFVPRKKDIIDETPEEHKDLVRKLVPGEVSIVVSRRKPAMRFIKQPTINSILKEIGEPLTATSANPSESNPARSAEDMRKYFACNRILVLFEGNVPEKLPSTIVDVSGQKIKILRQGSLELN